MALPFLKTKEGSASQTVETVERKHDDDFDLLDAIAGDVLDAVKKGDKAMLKDALGAFVDHIQALDQVQDQKG